MVSSIRLVAAVVLLYLSSSFATKCLPGWYTDCRGDCYTLIDGVYNWTDAVAKCQSIAADMPSIHTPVDNDVVALLGKGPGTSGQIWTGLQCLDPSKTGDKSEWQFRDGLPIDIDKWHSGMPASNPQRYVGAMSFDADEGWTWSNVSPQSRLALVCKRIVQ